MKRCFGIAAYAKADIVVDKPTIAQSTYYSSEHDLEKKIGFMQGTLFGRNCSAPLSVLSTSLGLVVTASLLSPIQLPSLNASVKRCHCCKQLERKEEMTWCYLLD